MVEEKNVNLDTENEDLDELEELETTEEESENDSDEVTALKDKNRQLFARAKKGEGFEQVDGKWLKKEEKKEEVKEEVKPEVKPEQVTGLTQEDVSAQVTATLEQRDLDAEDISDELKEEVKDYAKLKGISVKKALDSNYIKHELALEKGEELADDASIGGGTRKATTTFSETGTFDHSTDKGKEAFKKWEEKQKEELG